MSKSFSKIWMLFLVFCYTSPIISQIEDSIKVDAILLENKNLGKLYADFPNAMSIYKDSKRDKVNGILLETLGLGMSVLGGYLIFAGLLAEGTDKSSDYSLSLLDLTNEGGVAVVTGGLLVALTGIAITKSGSKKSSNFKIKKRGSAQQYIWDLEGRSEKKEIGSVSLEVVSDGIGILYTF